MKWRRSVISTVNYHVNFVTKQSFSVLAKSRYWTKKTLAQLNSQEWEALCDGCGKCCLLKLEDEDQPGQIYYTALACEWLDLQTCRCSDYENRTQRKADCIDLQPHMVEQFHWLPDSCGYRLISEGKSLPGWHPLISGEANSCLRQGHSVARRVISESQVSEDQQEEYIINWVN